MCSTSRVAVGLRPLCWDWTGRIRTAFWSRPTLSYFPNEGRSRLPWRTASFFVTRGTPAVLAAKKATTTTPIVMAAMGEPLMVVASLAHPGGNITGLSGYATDLEAKRAEVIKELVPGAVRIAGLYNMGNPVVPPQWDQLQAAARKLGMEPQLLDIRKTEDIAPAFDDAMRQRAGALMVSVEALTQENRTLIAQLAAKHRLPAIYVSKEYIDAGGLIAYEPSYPDLYRRAPSTSIKFFEAPVPPIFP